MRWIWSLSLGTYYINIHHRHPGTRKRCCKGLMVGQDRKEGAIGGRHLQADKPLKQGDGG